MLERLEPGDGAFHPHRRARCFELFGPTAVGVPVRRGPTTDGQFERSIGGSVLPVTASREALQRLADLVGAAGQPGHPADDDQALFTALAPVEQFAWDEGAETF